MRRNSLTYLGFPALLDEGAGRQAQIKRCFRREAVEVACLSGSTGGGDAGIIEYG